MKWDNVLVKIRPIDDGQDWEIQAKIIDFGISRDTAAIDMDTLNTATAQKDPLGAAPFLGPEILKFRLEKKNINPKAYTTGMSVLGILGI